MAEDHNLFKRMKIAIDTSPLNKGNYLQHRVRGTGYYINGLKKSLEKYHPSNEYIYFNRGERLQRDIDLIHIPYFEPFFLTLPFKKKTKTIVTVHDMTPFVFPDKFLPGLKGKIKWQIQKRNLKNMDAIIADSLSSKKDINKFTNVPESNIHVVYLAADEKFSDHSMVNLPAGKTGHQLAIRKKYDLPRDFLLYVGDVTWNKNLPNLIEAVNRTNFHLVIVGKAFKEGNIDTKNAWNQSLIKARGLAKKNKNIKILGFIPDDEIVGIYKSAAIFVMPSFYEGFGLPVVEAMSVGLPVITSERGSLKEVAGDSALFVDPDNISSIKKGIEKLMQDEKTQKELRKKSLEQAKKFSWEKTANQTNSIYEKIFAN